MNKENSRLKNTIAQYQSQYSVSRVSALQREIISILSREAEWGNFEYNCYEIMRLTGKLQPSIHRSLKALVNKGEVTKWFEKVEHFGELPKRRAVYCLSSLVSKNERLNKEIKKEQERINKREESEAAELGIDVISYRVRKFIG